MSISSSPNLANPREISAPTVEDQLRLTWRRGWTPPPRISVPAWADRYRRLAKEAGSTSGHFRTSKVEVARGPMLAVTEPGVQIITTMVCTQLLKTTLLENVFGYFAHLDPSPMLLVQPKEDAAEAFSKERITPLIRSTPALRDLVGNGKTRSSEDTLLFKAFPGGFLALVGAGSPDNLARRPVRIVLYDEVDKYAVTKEGDAITLGDERMATFDDRSLSIRACSPTIEGESRIEASYNDGDQRQASLECPHCGHRMFADFFSHVEWQRDDDGGHQPNTARIYCEGCGSAWEEGHRLRALATTRWHQTRPFICCGERQEPLDLYDRAWKAEDPDAVATVWEWWESDRYAVYRAKCRHCGTWPVSNRHASFTAGKLFSPWSKDSPAHQAIKWLAAKDDPDLRQVWWNTQAGRPYRIHSAKDVRVEALAARAERWPGEIPDGVGLLTAGIDTQDDRLEIEVVGWGMNEESWSIDYQVFSGDPALPDVWAQLDEYLKQRWTRNDGRQFVIEAACIDSGGHHSQAVYAFAKARLGRRVWAIKGESARGGNRSPVWPTVRPLARNRTKFRPVIIGTNAAKDTIRNRLALEAPGPGYMHFPVDRDINYYAQLTAERLVVKVAAGQRYRVWELPKGRANEALDCRVYAYAALAGLLHSGWKLNVRTEMLSIPPDPVPIGTVKGPKAKAQPGRRPAAGFLGNRKQGWLAKR